MSSPMGKYWRFYWPLTILSLALLSGKLLQNFVLLEYPNGVIELAMFVLAFQLFKPMNATLIMLPQVVNVLSTSKQAYASTLRFALFASIILSLPVFLLAWTSVGERAILFVFDLSLDRVEVVRAYLRIISPIITLTALSKCFTGILVKRRKTGVVTVLQVANLLVLAILIYAGFRAKLSAHVTIGGSWLISEMLFLVASLFCQKRFAPMSLFGEHSDAEYLTWKTIWNFAWPVAMTTFMFSLSRPIVFSFITKLDDLPGSSAYSVDAMVAGMGLVFSFQMIFHGMVNQFRDVFVTFGKDDFAGVIRFMALVTVFGTVAIATVNLTPLAGWYLSTLQGAEGETFQVARECLWVLILMPGALMLRNYYHGISLVHRRTKGMAWGGIFRNGGIIAGCVLLYLLNGYNHITAIALLVFGFFAEGIGVKFMTRKWRGELESV